MEKRISIIGLNLSVFLFMFGVGMIVPLLPQKIITFTGSLKTVGYLASAFAVPFVLLQFPTGRLSDRYGCRRFLVAGYLICSASGLIYCFSQTQAMIFFGRLLQGIGEAPLWALAPALLSMLYPAAKGKMIGAYNASLHLGLTLGSGFGILMAGVWVKNEPFVLFALSGLLGAFLIFVTVKDPRAEGSGVETALDTGGLKKILAYPGILAVFSGIILYGAGYGASLTVLPGFLIQEKGFTQAQIGGFFTLFYIGISLSQIITGPVSDRHGRTKTMILGLFMITAGLGMFPGRDGWGIYPWLFLASFGLGVFCVSALSWLNNAVADSLKGTISGAFYLFWGIGFFIGPAALGMFGEAARGFTGFHVLALLFLLQALVQWVLGYGSRKIGRGQTRP
ncbi:MFS transporter [Desulfotignum balticum]|jgi:MFS family permease|uniref:MFS transporter n=1 Tax=Desulfotignum balticum TaxID=115781 RepID=A0A931GBX1_9BACT|nr:MFS transporter [Desulfotignum balticum]MBG0779749.1 MFS transporter [Desulfotignum balticum]